MKRQLEFKSAFSSKFWHIELEGRSHTVTYGRIGSTGQSKTKEFNTEEQALASFEKLVQSKLKKGYVDVAEEGEQDGGDVSAPKTDFHTVIHESDIGHHVETFAGKKVVDFKPDAPADATYRFAYDWENEGDNFESDVQAFLASDASANATGIVIGPWTEEMYDSTTSGVIDLLAKNNGRLPNLKAIFLGDITSEENEMSWIEQSDISPLLSSYPNLEYLRVRGGNGLAINAPQHAKLRALALETGGMGVDVVRAVCMAEFPELEHLELWLGTEDYGGNSSVQDLQPILNGMLFPKLKYLGLRNCDYVDDICGVLVNSPVIEQIEYLDLSLGVLGDVGAQALLRLPTDKNLKHVNLHHHWISEEVVGKLRALGLPMDLSSSEQHDDEWRFVAVGE